MALPTTYLFVPGNRPDRFDKALNSGADAIILDLEDAVDPASKDAAREAVGAWLDSGHAADGRVLIRINDDTTPWYGGDCALLDRFLLRRHRPAEGGTGGPDRGAAQGRGRRAADRNGAGAPRRG